MMKKRNLVKILSVLLCSMLLVMCPVAAYANILNGEDCMDSGQSEVILNVDMPEEAFCKNYILITQNYTRFYLFILDDGDIVTVSGTGGSTVITLTGWTDGVTKTEYDMSGSGTWSNGWSTPTYIKYTSNTSYTITPPNVNIVESTIDLYKTGEPSTLLYAKNADILHPESDTGGDNTGGDSVDDPTDTPVFDPTTFTFIADPQTSTDMIYNLLLMDSMAAFAYLGYRAIKTVFARIRRFRNYKRGDK